jgi:hypothetical protein
MSAGSGPPGYGPPGFGPPGYGPPGYGPPGYGPPGSGPPGYGPPRPRSNTARNVVIALVVAVVLGFGGCMGFLMWAGSGPQAGVLVGNQIEPYARSYMSEHGLVDEDEAVVCYYDASIALDGSESAILTNRRVLYDKEGVTTAIDLADVQDVTARDEGMVGYVIDVRGRSGARLRIEIAPFNDGETFEAELRAAVASTQAPP